MKSWQTEQVGAQSGATLDHQKATKSRYCPAVERTPTQGMGTNPQNSQSVKTTRCITYLICKTQGLKKMSRNFGAGQRKMEKAGEVFAKRITKSYSSQVSHAQRFGDFVKFAKKHGISRLEQIERSHVMAYAQSLKERDLSASTQQNLLSTVNVIMKEARGDEAVRVTGREAGLEQRSGVAQKFKGSAERGELSDRTQAVVDLARSFGLRFEEASKLDASKALDQAQQNGAIKIEYGTKGGQAREVPVLNESQRETLQRASKIQGNDRSMISSEKSYAEHQRDSYKETSHFHAERHAYANERYSELMREKLKIEIKSPVLSNKPEGQSWASYIASVAHEQGVGITPEMARNLDREARIELAEELGHHREDVVSAYIGGQK